MWPFLGSYSRTVPKKKGERRAYNLSSVRKVLFPSSPVDDSRLVLPLKWDFAATDREALLLSQTGRVREKYLRFTPADVGAMMEEDIPMLEWLWERYFPASQPRSQEEEAYLSYMRESVEARLGEREQCQL